MFPADPGTKESAPAVLTADETLDVVVGAGVVEGETRVGIAVAGWAAGDDANGLGGGFCCLMIFG
jgi:hypothetical protein